MELLDDLADCYRNGEIIEARLRRESSGERYFFRVAQNRFRRIFPYSPRKDSETYNQFDLMDVTRFWICTTKS